MLLAYSISDVIVDLAIIVMPIPLVCMIAQEKQEEVMELELTGIRYSVCRCRCGGSLPFVVQFSLARCGFPSTSTKA